MHLRFHIRPMLFSALMLASMSLAVANLTSVAAATTRPAAQTASITIPMHIDCAHASTAATAQNWLKAHKLCSFSTKVQPNNSVTGNCGTLSLNVFNSNGGYMQWKAEITSSLGPFVAAHYDGYWLRETTGATGNVSRTGGFSSDWLDIFPIHTGTGFIDAFITSAWDTPVFGVLCTNNSVVSSSTLVH